MTPTVTIVIQAARLNRVKPRLVEPEFKRMFNQWAVVYLSQMRARFMVQSRGGGEWAPLSLRTKIARRGPSKNNAKKAKGKRGKTLAQKAAGRKFAILIDTKFLSRALTPGAPGNAMIQETDGRKAGIKVGFRGGHHSKGMTIGRLARIHHQGGKNLPARPILVKPSVQTLSVMRTAAMRAMNEYTRRQA